MPGIKDIYYKGYGAFHEAKDKVAEVTEASVKWVNDTASHTKHHIRTKVDAIRKRVKEDFWQKRVKGPQKIERVKIFYKDHPEHFNKKNAATMTGGVALAVFVTAGISLAGGPAAIPFGVLAGGIIFVGTCVVSQKRIQNAYNQRACGLLEDLKNAIEARPAGSQETSTILTPYNKLFNKEDSKLRHLQEQKQFKGITKAYDSYVEVMNNPQSSLDMLRDRRSALIQCIVELQKNLGKEIDTDNSVEVKEEKKKDPSRVDNQLEVRVQKDPSQKKG